MVKELEIIRIATATKKKFRDVWVKSDLTCPFCSGKNTWYDKDEVTYEGGPIILCLGCERGAFISESGLAFTDVLNKLKAALAEEARQNGS